jgi:hypothetical protein
MKYLDIMKTAIVDIFTLSGALVFVVACTQVLLKNNSAWLINLYPFYILGWWISLVFAKIFGLEE